MIGGQLNFNCTAECLDCRNQTPYSPEKPYCPACGSLWREARYNYQALGEVLPELLKTRPFDMWRYIELLPIREYNPSLSMGEGGTPLIRAVNLGMMLGCPNLYIKDERQSPTSSFKDRQAAVGVAALKEAGINEIVIASTGNVAIAYSAYAARAGIKLWAFLTSLVPTEKMREVAIYGAQVIKVTASYDQVKMIAAEFAHQRNLYLEAGTRTIPSVESMKTIAFEIAEQLTDQLGPDLQEDIHPNHTRYWRSPDWYFQSVSGGLGPLGVQKGFDELLKMGIIKRAPGLAIIQAEGCSPMVAAWQKGLSVAEPILSPRTHITTLATGDPGRTYSLLFHRINSTGRGVFESVTDEETFRTIHILAKMEGISVEPAAAVAFAGLIKLVRAGVIKSSDVIVINCTGHTMPVEKMILGDGWSQNLAISQTAFAATPQEGLLAALNHIPVDRYPQILLVDDLPDARRLIRRILQSQGDFSIIEASSGYEAIEITRAELPDLIILDLMMPEIDGFGVLDALKANPDTAQIPVIVVTAKELTAEENELLYGRIHSLMQKGQFMSDELVEEIISVVG
jgi:threonine synthase